MMQKVMIFIALLVLAATPARADEFVVKIKFDEATGRVFYLPATLKIKRGDTVTWIQEDKVHEHNIASYTNGVPKGTGLFESPMLRRAGARWSRKFRKSGTYHYHCHPHEALGMKARIIVDRESLAAEIRHAKAGKHMHGAGMRHGDARAAKRKSGRAAIGKLRRAAGRKLRRAAKRKFRKATKRKLRRASGRKLRKASGRKLRKASGRKSRKASRRKSRKASRQISRRAARWKLRRVASTSRLGQPDQE